MLYNILVYLGRATKIKREQRAVLFRVTCDVTLVMGCHPFRGFYFSENTLLPVKLVVEIN